MKSSAIILVSGSLAYDRIMNFGGVFSDHILPEKVHTLSVSFMVDSLVEHRGGTAGNIAYSLALLGIRPVVVASAGNDFEHYKKEIAPRGVETRGIRTVPKERTASAWIMTDRADNQITAFHPGAMLKPATAGSWWKRQKYDYAIAAPGCARDRKVVIDFARKKKIPFAFDPGQQLFGMSRSELRGALQGTDTVFVNDYELAVLLRRSGLTHAQLRGRVRALVTTLGSKGSRVESRGKTHQIPSARPHAVVDPTGAGDCYRAGFIYGLLAGWPLETVGRFAGLIAVYTVERAGTQTHKFTWKELRVRYKRNFGAVLPIL